MPQQEDSSALRTREQNLKLIQKEMELVKLIAADDLLMKGASSLLTNLQNNKSNIDSTLIFSLDEFTFQADTFCRINNCEMDGDFFNNLMFVAIYKFYNLSTEKIAQIKKSNLTEQLLKEASEPIKEKEELEKKLNKFKVSIETNVSLLTRAYSEYANKMYKKNNVIKSPIITQGIGTIVGFHAQTIRSIAEVVRLNEIDHLDEELSHAEKVVTSEMNLILEAVEKTTQENPNYIKQVDMLQRCMKEVSWVLSCYLIVFLVDNKTHSKQEKVKELLKNIFSVLGEEAPIECIDKTEFYPIAKCEKVIGLLEKCLNEIDYAFVSVKKQIKENNVTKVIEQKEINVENKARLLSLITTSLNKLYEQKDKLSELKIDNSPLNDEGLYQHFNEVNKYSKKYGSIDRVVRASYIKAQLYEVPIEDVFDKRDEVCRKLQGRLLRIIDKLSFGLVRFVAARYLNDSLIKVWNKKQSINKILPAEIIAAGGFKAYVNSLKPEPILTKVQNIEPDNIISQASKVVAPLPVLSRARKLETKPLQSREVAELANTAPMTRSQLMANQNKRNYRREDDYWDPRFLAHTCRAEASRYAGDLIHSAPLSFII